MKQESRRREAVGYTVVQFLCPGCGKYTTHRGDRSVLIDSEWHDLCGWCCSPEKDEPDPSLDTRAPGDELEVGERKL